jgi:hypothetical protein
LVVVTAAGDRGAPAAWARLEAVVPGRAPPQVKGGGDETRRATNIFGYPEPAARPLSSPWDSIAQPLTNVFRLAEQEWTIDIAAFYTPRAAVSMVPELNDIQTQRPATLWTTPTLHTPLTSTELKFGVETVMYTTGGAVLLLTADSSP